MDGGEVCLLAKVLQEFIVSEEKVQSLIIHLEVVFMKFLEVV